MKTIVVGLGVQGHKRVKVAKNDLVCTVDPLNPKADYKSINDVPINSFDTAIICVPELQKKNIIKYCLDYKKNILIEKPLITSNYSDFDSYEKISNSKKIFCYVAYNHRFEPNIIKLKKYLKLKKIGKIYSCRMFYGNGTAELVKKSSWRDNGRGVLFDLGSHLVDLLIFLFNINDKTKFELIKVLNNENKSPDHAIFISKKNNPLIELEMSLCSWKNEFKVDIIGSKGSLHINNLCKWGNSKFIYRKRIFPSGKPIEKISTIKYGDITWEKEYRYFKKMIKNRNKTTFKKDKVIQKILMSQK